MQGRSFAVALGAALVVMAAAIWAGCSGSSKTSSGPNAQSTPGATRPAPTSQVTTTLRMETASAAAGAEATVQLQALRVGQPGLGAWTLEIAFDQTVLSVSDCTAAPEPSVCNPKKNDHTVRMAGASGTGVQGDIFLATVVFKCQKAGSSTLHVTAEVFADATIGGPLDITPTIEDGSITCT